MPQKRQNKCEVCSHDQPQPASTPDANDDDFKLCMRNASVAIEEVTCEIRKRGLRHSCVTVITIMLGCCDTKTGNVHRHLTNTIIAKKAYMSKSQVGRDLRLLEAAELYRPATATDPAWIAAPLLARANTDKYAEEKRQAKAFANNTMRKALMSNRDDTETNPIMNTIAGGKQQDAATGRWQDDPMKVKARNFINRMLAADNEVRTSLIGNKAAEH